MPQGGEGKQPVQINGLFHFTIKAGEKQTVIKRFLEDFFVVFNKKVGRDEGDFLPGAAQNGVPLVSGCIHDVPAGFAGSEVLLFLAGKVPNCAPAREILPGGRDRDVPAGAAQYRDFKMRQKLAEKKLIQLEEYG